MTILVGLVAPGGEVSLACATSMLRLQQTAAARSTSQKPVFLEVHIAESADEVLNVARRSNVATMCAVVNGNVGVPPEFILDAVDTAHPLILGVHPLPKMHWEDVAKVAAEHNPVDHQTGLRFNVDLKAHDPEARYVPVEKARNALDVFLVRTSTLRAIAAEHPEAYDLEANSFMYICEDVHQGRRRTASDRFLSFFDAKEIVADVDYQCGRTGSAEFAGCVGLRGSKIR